MPDIIYDTDNTGTLDIYVMLMGPSPDLLQTVNNGLGGKHTISYKPSSTWPNPSTATYPIALN